MPPAAPALDPSLEVPGVAVVRAVVAHGNRARTGNVPEGIDLPVEELHLDIVRREPAEVHAGLHVQLLADLHRVCAVGFDRLDLDLLPALRQPLAPLRKLNRVLQTIA